MAGWMAGWLARKILSAGKGLQCICKWESPTALCSFSLPLIQFPSKISPVATDKPSVLLDMEIVWKKEGKAWTEVLEPWGGKGEYWNAGVQH